MDVKTLCLGVLNQGDASGYEIKKSFEEGPFAHIHAASFGSIYPALNALSAEGLVDCQEMAQDKRPDKKIYSITPSGQEAFARALLRVPAPDKVRSDFLFIFYFAQMLPAERLAQLVDQRIAWYRESLARMEDCDLCQATAGAGFVHGLGLAVYRAAADYLAANRQSLIDQARDAPRMVAE